MATLRIAIDARGAKAGATQFAASTGTINREAKRTHGILSGVGARFAALNVGAGILSKTMRQLGGVFAGYIALRHVVRTLVDFEQSMLTLGAVSRASAEDMVRLKDVAFELGSTTRFTATEVAEGLLFLARAGFTTNEAITAIPSALDLAAAGLLSLGEAADFASNILAQFALPAEEMVRVSDALVIVSNRSNTNVRQLSEALKFAGPIAGALGETVESTAAAIGALGDRGIQASLAGTNLRGILLALTNTSVEARKRLSEMGLTTADVSTESNTLVEVFENLRDANISAGDANELFGRRNAAAALILADSTEKMRELTQATAENEGEAKRVADAAESGLGGALRRLDAAIKKVILSGGEKGLSATLGFIADKITALLLATDKLIIEWSDDLLPILDAATEWFRDLAAEIDKAQKAMLQFATDLGFIDPMVRERRDLGGGVFGPPEEVAAVQRAANEAAERTRKRVEAQREDRDRQQAALETVQENVRGIADLVSALRDEAAVVALVSREQEILNAFRLEGVDTRELLSAKERKIADALEDEARQLQSVIDFYRDLDTVAGDLGRAVGDAFFDIASGAQDAGQAIEEALQGLALRAAADQVERAFSSVVSEFGALFAPKKPEEQVVEKLFEALNSTSAALPAAATTAAATLTSAGATLAAQMVSGATQAAAILAGGNAVGAGGAGTPVGGGGVDAGGGSTRSVTINQNIRSADASSFRRSKRMLRQDLIRGARRA